MSSSTKTVIVTGASQGIGAGIANEFCNRGYNVVATARNASSSKNLQVSPKLLRVDGDIAEEATAKKVTEAAVSKFGSIDALIANAGFFMSKPFPDYTSEDYQKLMAVNVEGFLYITQLAVKQMQAQKVGGSVTAITASVVKNPIAGFPVSVQMIAKGGLEVAVHSLALEYAKEGIRFNSVAPGAVATPLTRDYPHEVLKTFSPMGIVADVKDIADAVIFLTEARYVTGEVLHVDGGLHAESGESIATETPALDSAHWASNHPECRAHWGVRKCFEITYADPNGIPLSSFPIRQVRRLRGFDLACE